MHVSMRLHMYISECIFILMTVLSVCVQVWDECVSVRVIPDTQLRRNETVTYKQLKSHFFFIFQTFCFFSSAQAFIFIQTFIHFHSHNYSLEFLILVHVFSCHFTTYIEINGKLKHNIQRNKWISTSSIIEMYYRCRGSSSLTEHQKYLRCKGCMIKKNKC